MYLVTAVLQQKELALVTLFWSTCENHANECVKDSPGKDAQPFSRREACMRVREWVRRKEKKKKNREGKGTANMRGKNAEEKWWGLLKNKCHDKRRWPYISIDKTQVSRIWQVKMSPTLYSYRLGNDKKATQGQRCFVHHQVWDIDLIISKNSNHTNPTIAKKTAFAQCVTLQFIFILWEQLRHKREKKKGG